jgi:hypothetical protein
METDRGYRSIHGRGKILVGIGIVAIATNIMVTPSLWVTVPLLVFGVFLLGWGLAPAFVEGGISRIPYSGRFLQQMRRVSDWIEGAHAQTDGVSAQLWSEVFKLLRYPDAAVDQSPDIPTMIEQIATNQQPRRLFELLMRYEERDIVGVSRIGEKLREYLDLYYEFRQSALQFDADLQTKIIDRDWFLAAWLIHQRYATLRLFGKSKEQIITGGNFLNYGITWNSAEKVFERISGDVAIISAVSKLEALHERLRAIIVGMTAST